MTTPQSPRPLALKKEGEDRLVIEWSDGSALDLHLAAPAVALSLCRLPRGALAAARPVPHPQAGRTGAAQARCASRRSAATPTRSPGATATTPAFIPSNICEHLQCPNWRSKAPNGDSSCSLPAARRRSPCPASSTSSPWPAARAASANRPSPPTSPSPCTCRAGASA